MKRIILFLSLIVGLFLIPVTLIAQAGEVSPILEFEWRTLFTTFAGFCAGIVILTGFVTANLLTKLTALGRSILSWVIATIIGYIGYFLHLGIFDGILWYEVLAIVVSFAIGSNVIYNIGWVRELLASIKMALPKRELKEKVVPNKLE